MFLWLYIFSIILLSSCSFYQSAALNKAPNFVEKPENITIDLSKISIPELKAHKFKPSDGLDRIEIATLAVLNNPELKLARHDAAISHAQAFSAGLLPDPQLGISQDYSISNNPDLSTAYTAGLSYDVLALLKLPTALAAGVYDDKKADLNLLWQEWQTLNQAELLFSKTLADQKRLRVLQDYYMFLKEKRELILVEVEKHNLANDAASAVLSAYDDINTKFTDVMHQLDKDQHDLNALLGLAPDTELKLQDQPIANFDSAELAQKLAELPRRRPDLLALEAGYNAEDERYLQSIISQFPAVNIGFVRARDTSYISTNGFALTVNLPVFNRNQGGVAIEKATRQKLQDEYQIRINKAHEEVMALNDEHKIDLAQNETISKSLVKWDITLAKAEQALKRHNIDLFTYINLRNAQVTSLLEKVSVEQALQQQNIGMQILLAESLDGEGK